MFIMVSEDLNAAEDCWFGRMRCVLYFVMSCDIANRMPIAREKTCFRS